MGCCCEAPSFSLWFILQDSRHLFSCSSLSSLVASDTPLSATCRAGDVLSASRQALLSQVCRLIFTLLYTRFVVIIAYGIFWLNRLALVICESGAFPSCVVNLLGRTLLIVYTVAGRRVFRPRRCPWTLRRTGKKNSAAILGQIGWNRYNWMKISLLGPVAFIRNCSRQYPNNAHFGVEARFSRDEQQYVLMIFVVSSSPTARAPSDD